MIRLSEIDALLQKPRSLYNVDKNGSKYYKNPEIGDIDSDEEMKFLMNDKNGDLYVAPINKSLPLDYNDWYPFHYDIFRNTPELMGHEVEPDLIAGYWNPQKKQLHFYSPNQDYDYYRPYIEKFKNIGINPATIHYLYGPLRR